MTDNAEKPILTPAEHNPWYLLATLYSDDVWGEPKQQRENRTAWNRYYAARLTDEQKIQVEKNVTDKNELRPFSAKELESIKAQFEKRSGGRQIEIPDPKDDIDFRNCQFISGVNFRRYFFINSEFIDCKFDSTAQFSDSVFLGNADFSGVNFSGDAKFRRAVFIVTAEFNRTVFFRQADFNGVHFLKDAYFSVERFHDGAFFNFCVFSGQINFSGSVFAGHADFSGTRFEHDLDFSRVKFKKYSDFINAKLEAPADFDSCHFEKIPPQLHGATLHHRTNWRRVVWPDLNGLKPRQVEDLTDAYCCLKLEMEKQKRHEDELLFFAKELESRRVELGRIRGLPISLYWITSDYGRSYYWSFLWLVALFNAGIPALFFLQPDLGWSKAVGLSAVNCLAGFGLRKELMGKTVESLGTGALVVSGIQMVLGLVFLFLVGLGLRNRFRMK